MVISLTTSKNATYIQGERHDTKGLSDVLNLVTVREIVMIPVASSTPHLISLTLQDSLQLRITYLENSTT